MSYTGYFFCRVRCFLVLSPRRWRTIPDLAPPRSGWFLANLRRHSPSRSGTPMNSPASTPTAMAWCRRRSSPLHRIGWENSWRQPSRCYLTIRSPMPPGFAVSSTGAIKCGCLSGRPRERILQAEHPIEDDRRISPRSPAISQVARSQRRDDRGTFVERELGFPHDGHSGSAAWIGNRSSRRSQRSRRRHSKPADESGSSFDQFLLLGIEHILKGYDHLLFLLALLVVAPGWLSSLKVITCFTIAHSITLAVATLDLIQVPGRFVEPLIAASIIYVGVENILRRGDLRGRCC